MNDPLMANIECPYFVALTKVSLSCEGIESEKIMQWFMNEDTKREYIQRYCVNKQSDCPIFKALEKKYASTM